MEIKKQAGTLGGGTPDEGQLQLVNLQSKRPLTAEEVYVFALRLCDDQVDRDYERFSPEALEALGKLFVGKPGIVDHNWSAEKQVARIFDTEVCKDRDVTWLKGWAYIPRQGKEQLIGDIESGIRKEVSISCSIEKKVCSLCGGIIGHCGHQPGREYDGKTCVGILQEPGDAYEFSFVAVPAQPAAGVIKHRKGGEEMNLKEYVEGSGLGALKKELEKLKRMAEYGRTHREKQEQEFVRMAVALELGPGRGELERLAMELEDDTLDKLCMGLGKKMSAHYGGKSQLAADQRAAEEKDAYLI